MVNKGTFSIVIVEESDLTKDQIRAIRDLEKVCFSDVTDEEAKEDFYDRKVARIFAYRGEEIVGCAGVHLKELNHNSNEIVFGGPSGFCVKETMRHKGIGSLLCKTAMNYLKDNKCEVAFLSVSKDNPARKLYKKFGFQDLPVNYSWKKSTGKTGTDNDGMLAPVNNQELFNEIMNSNDVFYVGNGYW